MAEALNFVVAVILNRRGELLLLHRSPSAKRDPEKWGLAGGRIEAGEEPEAAMHRELAEELGEGMALHLEARLGPIGSIGTDGGKVHLFRYTMLSEGPHLNHEHTDFRWVDAAGIQGLDLMPGVHTDLTLFGIRLGRPQAF